MSELWVDVNVLSRSRNFLNYRKIANNSWGVYLFQSLNRPGGNLGQIVQGNSCTSSAREVVVAKETIQPTSKLLPPSTRQPDPVAVVLGQLRFIFSPISHSLGVDRETSSSCFSRVFLCIFYGRKFEFQAVLFIFLLQLWQLLCCHGDGYNIATNLVIFWVMSQACCHADLSTV